MSKEENSGFIRRGHIFTVNKLNQFKQRHISLEENTPSTIASSIFQLILTASAGNVLSWLAIKESKYRQKQILDVKNVKKKKQNS